MVNQKKHILSNFSNSELMDELERRYEKHFQELCTHVNENAEYATEIITDPNNKYYGRKRCLICGKIF